VGAAIILGMFSIKKLILVNRRFHGLPIKRLKGAGSLTWRCSPPQARLEVILGVFLRVRTFLDLSGEKKTVRKKRGQSVNDG
jgi:hypothetical protein